MSTQEVPEYEVVAVEGRGQFFAPNYIPPGSRVRTWAAPNQGLVPLNDAARARLEEWYNEEHQTANKRTGEPVFDHTGAPVMYKPHAMFRPMGSPKAKVASPVVEVIAEPVAASQPIMSLAAIMAGTDRKNTDQRPPPAHVRPEAAPEDDVLPVEVIAAAAPKSTVTRSGAPV